MENKRKLSTGFVILIVILILALIGITSYVVYDSISSKDDTLEDSMSDGKKENTEKEVFDNTIRDELSKKVKILEKIANLDTEQYRSGYLYKNSINNSELDGELKLYNILENLYLEKDGKSPITTDYDVSIFGGEPVVQIDVTEVEDSYYNLYGNKTITHKDSKNNCPAFIYDSRNQKYYGASACGGTSGVWLETYITNYTEDNNNYYVYVSLGAYQVPENATDKIELYTDYERKNKYREVLDEEVYSSNGIINSSNYSDFSQYKYIFTKSSSGSYYFERIERLTK